MYKLSVIIPAKNEEKLLGRLLKTLQAQKNVQLQIILADAKSTDKTRTIAKKYGALIISGGLPGPGRNAGVKHAKHERLLFLDADVFLSDPHCLERTLTLLETKKISLATFWTKTFDGTYLDDLIYRLWDFWTYITQGFYPHAAGYCIFSTKSVHNKIGGFDETIRLAEDANYVQRASKIAKFSVIPSEKIYTSARRIQKEGLFGLAWKMVFCGIFRAFGWEDRKNTFKYEFEHSRKK